MTDKRNLPEVGDKFIVKKLGRTATMLVAWKYIRVRQEGITVTFSRCGSGNAGDVWLCEHDDGLTIGAYVSDELERIDG